MTGLLKTLVREPLVHFLLLGAAIFAGYSLVSRNASGEPGRIVITRDQLASMMVGFNRTWQRPPTPEEWEGLVRDRVREEVYYREALALELDKDDLIIRRRLRQKMEFVTDDVTARAQPTDSELQAFLQAHPDTFRVDPRFTFRQLYLNPQTHGDHLARDAAELVATLNQPAGETGIETMGDPLLLERTFTAVPASEVAKQFGEKFAASLGHVAPGRWQGPVESGFGAHVVFVAERTSGRLPPLQDVREAVIREWKNASRRDANEKIFREMLKRYTVTIEGQEPAEAAQLTRRQ
jgi:hypothetical protein